MLIIREMFVNVCIFVTVMFIGSQIFQSSGLGTKAPLKVQVLSGITNGVFGIVLMIFSIPIGPGIILDFRQLAIIVGAMFSGWRSVFITGMIMATYRILYFNTTTKAVIAGVGIIIMTLGCMGITAMKVSRAKQWIYMALFTGITASAVMFILIKDFELFYNTMGPYWLGTVISNIIVYYLGEYLAKAYSTLKRLKEEAFKDYLTGLDNVRSFDKKMNHHLDKAKEKEESIAFLAVDVDFFKKVNDTHGHLAGDAVLRELGCILQDAVRDFDVVARVGGEEFGIMLRDCDCRRGLEIAERVRKKVEKHSFVLPDGKAINITISIGIAVYPSTVAEKDLLRERADEKLYEAKHSGRNKVCI